MNRHDAVMYNLFVSGHEDAWNGEPFQLEQSRCVYEYTDEAIHNAYGALTPVQVQALRRLPCIFAYETARRRAPLFGQIRDVVVRQGQVRIDYDIHPITPFLQFEQLETHPFEFDLSNWEMNRTHWAVKDVDLATELHRLGITLPLWARATRATVDIENHQFDVGLSFPGEARPIVERIVALLEGQLGPDTYFYDYNYQAQLARPAIDTLLQDIYRTRSRLLVVFIGADYQRKDWCGIEWHAIRDIMRQREFNRVMYIKLDDGQVDGVFGNDGYIDARTYTPEQIATFIVQRLALLR